MLTQMLDFAKQNDLFRPEQKILVAVSGGVDSVVLVNLLHESGVAAGVAHCNFDLRSKESDKDEDFVKALASKLGIPFFTTRFDTRSYAEENGIGLQEAARELRYSWFHGLIDQEAFNAVAVGTHLNDQLETMLLNFAKGTGLAGLHGILANRDNVIRPLMFCNRSQIMTYAKERRLEWREDSSNVATKYQRNLIRHNVIPVLAKINTRIEYAANITAQNVLSTENILQQLLIEKRKQLGYIPHEDWKINVKQLQELQPVQHWIYHLLRPFGFNASQSFDIALTLHSQEGKQFQSKTHGIFKERNHLLITSLSSTKNVTSTISVDSISIKTPVQMKFNVMEAKGNNLKTESLTALLDYSQLTFPLEVRQWRPGDKFVPLGMKSHKKVSDFLIDAKVPLNKKQDTFVITSGSDMVWLVGHRIDDRYKVTEHTKSIYRIDAIHD